MLLAAALVTSLAVAKIDETPKDLPETPGGTAVGGPDAFGYQFIDSFSAGGPAYNFQSIAATGFNVPSASTCDDCVSSAIPIGFSFSFYGNTYTQAYVSSNGFLGFSAGMSQGCCSGGLIPSNDGVNNVVSMFWDDLYPGNSPGGSVKYQTLGSSPNQVFIVQFTSIRHYFSGPTVTFQAKLFQGSNDVEVHYQVAPTDGSTHTGGIENAAGTIGLQYFRHSSALSSLSAVRYFINLVDSDGDGISDAVDNCVNVPNPLQENFDGDALGDACDPDDDNDGLDDVLELSIGTDPLNPDTDGDGLTDGEEYLTYGTDPLNPDTDFDGVNDYDELFTYGTDPLNADTDGDGLLDGEELFTWGTDPLNPDTDGDGLDDGLEVLVWGTDPLNPDTDGDFLTDGDEVYLYGTNPALADTDGDGLTDGQEVLVYGTDPLLADTDGDGLSDFEEIFTFGTDPVVADTDGDGLSDGAEVGLGTDPLDTDSDNDGLTDGEEVLTYGTDPLDRDSDDDGLTDGREVNELGTNPLSADTDSDGITDPDELDLGTDPVNPDTDGDGLIDGDELIAGTDPLNPDTDGDGVLDGDEVLVYGCDPLDADTDGDLFSDGSEVAGGSSCTNPTSIPTPVGPVGGVSEADGQQVPVTDDQAPLL